MIEPKYFTDEFEEQLFTADDIFGNTDESREEVLESTDLIPLSAYEQLMSVVNRLNYIITLLTAPKNVMGLDRKLQLEIAVGEAREYLRSIEAE